MDIDVPNLMQNSLSFNFGGKTTNTDTAQIINKTVCYNQGHYIQFEYLLGLRHMKVKEEISKTNPDLPSLVKYMRELFQFANDTIKEVSKINFQRLQQHFTTPKSNKIAPRICIKTIGDKDQIVDFYRSGQRAYVAPKHDVSSNTGFDHVADNGIYYLSNDIPSAAKQGIYVNPRLNPQRASNYVPPKKEGLFRRKEPEIDRNWCNCWKHPGDTVPAGWHHTCYKSTLIVPMTLKGCELQTEFKKKFFANSDSRMIWGFLCLDHHSANYFNTDNEIDAKMGYIFADLLSLYFISAYIHMELSGSFLKGLALLKENNLLPTEET